MAESLKPTATSFIITVSQEKEHSRMMTGFHNTGNASPQVKNSGAHVKGASSACTL
jgi:ferritin